MLVVTKPRDCELSAHPQMHTQSEMQKNEKPNITRTTAAVATRSLLDAATTRSHEESLAGEQAAQRVRGDDDDFMEGIMAFMQKRDPVFDPEKRAKL